MLRLVETIIPVTLPLLDTWDQRGHGGETLRISDANERETRQEIGVYSIWHVNLETGSDSV